MSLRRLHDVIGITARIRKIKPPGRSYADWKRFLDDCEAAGLVAYAADNGDVLPAEPFGWALHKRWRWLIESVANRVPYEQAEQAWDAAVERDREAHRQAVRQEDRQRSKAMRERNSAGAKRRNSSANAYQPEEDDLLGYASGVGL